ncbi:MAG: T9SS type A sorting domain-containing protein, partial [Saprospiraceae bacterium]|nr:T9SS type A sorting domain-containing protein [Saprospiraceae bacterium]
VTDINIDITMPYYGADMQAEIMISDLQGKVIYGDAIAPYSYKYTIEKGVLPSGVYLVSLKVKGKVVVSSKVSVGG